MNILDTEQMGRYRAYLEEYKGYYANAQSDEERQEILRKVEELCQAEFGVPADWLYIQGIQTINPLPVEEQQRLQNKPTQDIKSLKIVVMVLAAIVVYLLMKKK